MDTTEIINRLKKIITPYVSDKQAVETLTADTDFITDLNINSANLVDIVLDIEDDFKIEIDNESMQKMLTVDATINIIKTKLAQS